MTVELSWEAERRRRQEVRHRAEAARPRPPDAPPGTVTLRCPRCHRQFAAATAHTACPWCGPFECFCPNPTPGYAGECQKCHHPILGDRP